MNKRNLWLVAAGVILLGAVLWWTTLRSKPGVSPAPAAVSRPAPAYIPPQPPAPEPQTLPQPDEPPAGIPAGVHTGAFDPESTRKESKLKYEAHQKEIQEEEKREAADGARERAAWLASRPQSDAGAGPDDEGDIAKMEAREKEKREALKKSFKAGKKRSRLKAPQQSQPVLPPPLIFGNDQEPPPGMNPKLYTGGKKPDGTQKSPAGK